jgi:hypothetical protein
MPTFLMRSLLLCSVAAVLVVLVAGPAMAHGRGSDATNFSSTLTDTPQLDGVTWRVIGGDEYLAVHNTSDAELLVYGYEGEPYLRVGPDGVWQNAASPATYLNQSRYAEVTSDQFPAEVGPEFQPRWERIADEPRYAWHDHRIHWMAPTLPPQVTDPARRALITDWEVPFQVGGQDHAVAGRLEWVPGPSPLPWIAGGLAVALPGLLGLRRGPGERWTVRLARPAAAVLAATAVLNVTHLVDDLFAVPQPLASAALAAVQTALFILIGALGAVRGWRGGSGAFTALGVGSAALFVGQGILYLSTLTTSQTTSVFPTAFTRAAVALSLAQILPVGIVALTGSRRLSAEPVDAVAAEAQPAPSPS